MEVEQYIRGDTKEILNFLHCIKRTVDKGGQTIWKKLPQQTMVLEKLLRHGKEDEETSITQ